MAEAEAFRAASLWLAARASACARMSVRPSLTSRTSWPKTSARSTFERIARWSSSSETGLTSGPTCPG